jgi:hypothetical protein
MFCFSNLHDGNSAGKEGGEGEDEQGGGEGGGECIEG